MKRHRNHTPHWPMYVVEFNHPSSPGIYGLVERPAGLKMWWAEILDGSDTWLRSVGRFDTRAEAVTAVESALLSYFQESQVLPKRNIDVPNG